MNVFNLIKDIFEFFYYITGILGIILIYLAVKKDKKEEAKEFSKTIKESNEQYNILKDYLKKELQKDDRGNNKYFLFYLPITIEEYFKGKGELSLFSICNKLNENPTEEYKESIEDFFKTLKGSKVYLENQETNEEEFINDLKNYLACTIVLITFYNYNHIYEKELRFIANLLKIEKPVAKIFKNKLWKEF